MQHAGISALWARKMNLYTSDVLVWAIDKLRADVLHGHDGHLIADPLLYLGPSSPTQSPTWAQSDYYVPTQPPTFVPRQVDIQADGGESPAPSTVPTTSPGMHRPHEYINNQNMSWLIPVGMKHIRDVFTSPHTHERVKKALQDMSVLHKALSSVSIENMYNTVHPFSVLKALDVIRRYSAGLRLSDTSNMPDVF
jgi:hypothetical protein